MAATAFNISKGRAIEFGHRVNNNDPAAAVLTMVQLSAMEALSTLEDYDTLATLLAAAGNTECAYTNYTRLDVSDVELAAISPDDAANHVDLVVPQQEIAVAGGAANETIAGIVWCYDPLGTGVDANMIPIQAQDDGRLTSGSKLVWESGTIYRAS